MSTKLSFGRDIQGMNAYAPHPSQDMWQTTLTVGAEATVTVPSNFDTWVVSFRYFPNDVWVDVSGNPAAVPADGALRPTTSELNPAALTLAKGTPISMITGQTTADVSVVMWPQGPQQ